VAQDSSLQSLIPYLDSTEHPFALKIAFPAHTRDSRDNHAESFIILNDTDALTRLFMGKLVMKSGSTLKDLYLLVQRDQYHLPFPLPHLHNNIDIEHSWQEAARLFASSQRGALSFAPEPTGEKGILPFRSLFFCSFRSLFFHPPCPSCGGLLELCADDDVLNTAGLAPYSASLQRYLYCPSCIATGKDPLFFAPRRGDDDPPVLEDLQLLSKGFGQILGNAKVSFPCSSCPETTTCYGPEGKAGGRILSFSFFPFYLMAFDSYPVDAMDYLKSPSPRATSSAPEVREKPRKEAESKIDTPAEEPENEPAAVIDVLLGLRKKWTAALPKPEAQPAAKEAKEVPEQDIKELPVDMLEKTMIFSPAEMERATSAAETPAKKDTPPSPSSEPPQIPPQEVLLEKTMIFSPGTVPAPPSATEKPPGKAPPAAPKPPRQPSGEILEKTMISTPNGEKHDAPEKEKKGKGTEAIPETVIMSLNDLKGKK